MIFKQRRYLLFIIPLIYLWMLITDYREADVLGWDYNTTRNASYYIFNNRSTLILPDDFCVNESFLLVIVCSSPTNFEARDAIRNTWGMHKDVLNKTVSVFFLLGEVWNASVQGNISLESEQYNDIIQENFLDSYNNLTLKTINLVKLVTYYCITNTKFVLKVDDDIFVNTKSLVQLLKKNEHKDNVLIGNEICEATAVRDPTNKWYTSRYMFRGNYYPNYVSGTGYVMSIDAAERLFSAAMETPIFHLEDVYLTGICAQKANVDILPHHYFVFRQKTIDVCLMRKGYTFHQFNATELYVIEERLKDPDLPNKCRLYRDQVYKAGCHQSKKHRRLII